MNLFRKILKTIAKVSLPIFSFDENELKFQIDSNEMLSYKLENFDYKTRHDPYTVEAFTLKNRDIFLEYIRLDSDCSWNQDSFGAFKSLLKDKLKLKSMKQLDEHSFENYTLSTYLFNNKDTVHLIHAFEMFKDTFIVDTKGDLYLKLMNSLYEKFTYEHSNKSVIDIDFDISLTKQNAFSSYFQHHLG